MTDTRRPLCVCFDVGSRQVHAYNFVQRHGYRSATAGVLECCEESTRQPTVVLRSCDGYAPRSMSPSRGSEMARNGDKVRGASAHVWASRRIFMSVTHGRRRTLDRRTSGSFSGETRRYRTLVDPVNFALIGLFAGLEQARDTRSVAYGQGFRGYAANATARAMADFAIGTTLGWAAILSGASFPARPALLLQRRRATKRSRAGYAHVDRCYRSRRQREVAAGVCKCAR